MILLRRQRKLFGLSQEQAARRIGVSQGTYCDWENGKNSPQPSNFKKLSRVLEIDPKILLGAVYPGLDETPGEAN